MDDEATYSLATIDTPNFTGIRTLTYEEFENIFNQISDFEKFYNEDALYNLIELNYQDLTTKIDFYLNQHISDPRINFNTFSNQFLDINRLILNLLSSIRTYLDHTETRLKRTYGEKSVEYGLFKKLTSDSFDNHFAYRFLSKLRNYSQHCGLPTGSLSLTNNLNGHSLELSLVRDDLLENFDKWGSIVKPELKKQNSKFDIIPLLEKKAELLKDINKKVSSIILISMKNSGNHLLELIQETQIKGKGIPCLLKISGPIDSPTMEIKWFPFDIISKITGIEIKVVPAEK